MGTRYIHEALKCEGGLFPTDEIDEHLRAGRKKGKWAMET
jgi:hypothetical protein